MKSQTYQAGDFDRQITRLAKSIIQDAYGDRGTHYDPIAGAYWAKFEPGGSAEKEDGKGIVAEQTDQFVLRYTTDFTETDRLDFEGKIYDVTNVSEAPGTRRQYTVITAKRTDQLNPAS